MKAILNSILLTMLCLNNVSYGAKVLILHPMYAASHVLTLRVLGKALVEQGHEVDVIRWKDNHHYPSVNHPNITEHVFAINNSMGGIPHLTVEERASFLMPKTLMWGKGTSWTGIPVDTLYTISAFCSTLFEKTSFIESLRRRKYDVAIVDLIYNECSLALAKQLDLPSIGYWAFSFAGFEPQYTTAFSPPSSVPLIMSHYEDVMSLHQRIFNHFLAISSHLLMQFEFAVTNHQIQNYLPGTPYPSTLLANLSGLLINSHPAVDYPRLLPPSFINVGGMQIHATKPLPAELEEFITGSGDAGLVLFTMGFIFNSSVVPASVMSAVMGAFGKLEQRVLMKLEDEYPSPPSNVKVVKWLPQQDILAHPKTVLFFTHCGMHGVMEALHHGVPMVGMPVFIDQQDVLVRLLHRGVAVGVPKDANEDVLFEAMTEVLNNSMYKKNALALSRVIKDQVHDPLHHALWLVNHVVNTKGAEHLKFSARHLNMFQFFGLDVLVYVLCVIALLMYFVLPLLRTLLRTLIIAAASCFGNKEKND